MKEEINQKLEKNLENIYISSKSSATWRNTMKALIEANQRVEILLCFWIG